jgi:hypothetical protein
VPPKLPRFRAQAEQAQDAERLGRILLDVDEAPASPKPVNVAGGGSPNRMRGVPIVGVRGASGTSPGTDPLRETVRREGHRRRR